MGEQSEKIVAFKILEGISLTGDGSEGRPYLVTYISDEKEFLFYINEDFKSQMLLEINDRQVDCITTKSGKAIYFDVTDCMLSAQRMFTKVKRASTTPKDEGETKKWWKFWE